MAVQICASALQVFVLVKGILLVSLNVMLSCVYTGYAVAPTILSKIEYFLNIDCSAFTTSRFLLYISHASSSRNWLVPPLWSGIDWVNPNVFGDPVTFHLAPSSGQVNQFSTAH